MESVDQIIEKNGLLLWREDYITQVTDLPKDKLENVAKEKVMFAALLLHDRDKDELLLHIF